MATLGDTPVTDLADTSTAAAVIDTPIASPSSTTHVLPSPFGHSDPVPVLVTQGAEALVYRTTFLDASAPIQAALKFRPSKPYRHATLDQRLTKQRVLSEARVLVKLAALKADGIHVPALLGLEWDVARKVKGLEEGVRESSRGTGNLGAGAWLLMEWVEGSSVKQLLRDWDVWMRSTTTTSTTEEMRAAAEDQVKKLLRRMGKAVAAMHFKGGVVHGDLTSSNIMVRPTVMADDSNEQPDGNTTTDQPPSMEGEIVLIDFGLAVQSVQEEDRAVDLYVLERAFGSTHPRQEGWFDAEVLQHPDGYRGAYKGANIVLKRLEDVRLRGRKRSMLG